MKSAIRYGTKKAERDDEKPMVSLQAMTSTSTTHLHLRNPHTMPESAKLWATTDNALCEKNKFIECAGSFNYSLYTISKTNGGTKCSQVERSPGRPPSASIVISRLLFMPKRWVSHSPCAFRFFRAFLVKRSVGRSPNVD